MKIEVLPPDVNESHMYFAPSPDGKAIRFGMAAIKNVGEAAVEAILKARTEGGKFKTLSELCERVDGRSLTRKTIEALVKTGACDSFSVRRARDVICLKSNALCHGQRAFFPTSKKATKLAFWRA